MGEVKQVENINKNLQSFLEIKLSHQGLSHTEQECQESLIQRKTHNQQNSNKVLKGVVRFKIM